MSDFFEIETTLKFLEDYMFSTIDAYDNLQDLPEHFTNSLLKKIVDDEKKNYGDIFRFCNKNFDNETCKRNAIILLKAALENKGIKIFPKFVDRINDKMKNRLPLPSISRQHENLSESALQRIGVDITQLENIKNEREMVIKQSKDEISDIFLNNNTKNTRKAVLIMYSLLKNKSFTKKLNEAFDIIAQEITSRRPDGIRFFTDDL